MDKDTRNRIQRATQAARGLLEQDFEDQLAGVFDIRLDGTIVDVPGSHLDPAQRIVRTKLVAAVEHFRASGQTAAEAVASYRREAAFTTLNRFVALKMLEARGLLQECISRGEQSSGFKEFCGLAPGLVQLPDHGYRLYIESLFDEIGREVRVLFDRRDPASLLWPARATLFGSQPPGLLEILNDPELAAVWDQDETIGWVYQYYNDPAERKRMRDASAAPRNSRELAVRNQFFTPRYVVEFLIDNTLGRLWCDMQRGRSRLDDLEFLVRREGSADAAPCPPKDPRDIRVIDPACGSGHFLLYAFDLLLVIYAEAWSDPALGPALWRDLVAPDAEETPPGSPTVAPDITHLNRALPALILRHNLFGIDIDPRAVQIAALALWLRAQRAFNDLGIQRGERAPIRRTQLVVAEPMPSEPDLRAEFLDGLDPDLARLVGQVFSRLALAGSAGALLRIETDLGDLVRTILRPSLPGPLFADPDRERWERAEQKVLAALRAYAERAENGAGFRRRLFTDDTAAGFAFIDQCRWRYDVVVMNPPFGAAAGTAKGYIEDRFPRAKQDLLACFVERGLDWLDSGGRLGAITSRTPFFLGSFRRWREEVLLGKARPTVFADLGHGVMDAAMVEAAAYCLIKQ
jgi:hypothetical protein